MQKFIVPLINGVSTFSVSESTLANHLVTFKCTDENATGNIDISCRAAGFPVNSFLPVEGGTGLALNALNMVDFKFPIVEIHFSITNVSGSGDVVIMLSNW